jgi:2-polyprenyl-3-methyl-5-hydroxy-6-metoxy-1,4-benzoquinol methylase
MPDSFAPLRSGSRRARLEGSRSSPRCAGHPTVLPRGPGHAAAGPVVALAVRQSTGIRNTRDEGIAIITIAALGHLSWSQRPLPRAHRQELLDGRDWDAGELRENLRDIRRVNRLGGGTAAVVRALPSFLDGVPVGREVVILDLATGSGDIPLAICAWAGKRQRSVRVIASDFSGDVLAIAAERARSEPKITLTTYDARNVELPDRAVDVVVCSLALHHFEPPEAVAVLREMHRLSRRGFIVNDLVRCRSGYVAALITSRLLTRNRLTRHDAPLSVRRAYTPVELADLMREAGIECAVVFRRPLFRMVGVWRQRE